MRYHHTLTLATLLVTLSGPSWASTTMEPEAPTSPTQKKTVGREEPFMDRLLSVATMEDAKNLSQDLLDTRLYFQNKGVTFGSESDSVAKIRLQAFTKNELYYVSESKVTNISPIQRTSWVALCTLTLDLLQYLEANDVNDSSLKAALPSLWEALLDQPNRLLSERERQSLIPLKTALLELLDTSVAPGLQALYIQQKIRTLRERFKKPALSSKELEEQKDSQHQSDCNYFARRNREKIEQIEKLKDSLASRSPLVLWNAITSNAPVKLLTDMTGTSRALDTRKLWKISTRFLKGGTDTLKYEKRANHMMRIITKSVSRESDSFFSTSLLMKSSKEPRTIGYWKFIPTKLEGPSVHDLISIIGVGLLNSDRLGLTPKIYGPSQMEQTTVAPSSKRRNSKGSGSFWNFLSK